MFLTTHAAAGIVLSQYIQQPLPLFAASFSSHFILDFIPHGDDQLYRDEEWKIHKKYRRVVVINALDLIGVIGLVIWTISRPPTMNNDYVVLAILGSILPDFLNFLFPVIHERLSWLWLIRWLYHLTLPTGLRFLVRAQNWLHRTIHHDIIHRDVSLRFGIGMQMVLFIVFIVFAYR